MLKWLLSGIFVFCSFVLLFAVWVKGHIDDTKHLLFLIIQSYRFDCDNSFTSQYQSLKTLS